ncbi:MAG: SpoIID/LytB domain-containing protein [Oligoflexia bacterium]|nr:SpoIID/LytB domain-containing protein [Oligoflexia bacterium]
MGRIALRVFRQITAVLLLGALPGFSHAAPRPFEPRAELLGEARIRVRIAEAIPMATLRGFDLRIGTHTQDAASEWEFRCQDDRIRALQVGGTRTLELASPVTIETPAGFLQFRGRPYREELRIHSVGSLCEVINVVRLEKYLKGLVNTEFSSRWNEEAIAAQVIAARTYAMYQMRQAMGSHFDVDATVRDQVYDGSIKEDSRASRSVEKTRGVVLTVGPAQAPVPLKAFYHSTCGGRTELPERVWGAPVAGFRRAVPCPYCAHSPVMSWTLELKGEVIRDSLLKGARAEEKAPTGWPGDWLTALKSGRLTGLRIGKMESGGRVAELLTSWSIPRKGGAPKTVELPVPAARFRDWIGPGRFRSTSFQLGPSGRTLAGGGGRSWQFRGRGNGHGVGMCQYGAKTMGERGHKAMAILKHYYPDAIPRKLW